jgi:hypothetical protein
MIFKESNEYYIIWLKKRKLTELNLQLGYEVRTLYKIQAERDFKKINEDLSFKKNSELTYYY